MAAGASYVTKKRRLCEVVDDNASEEEKLTNLYRHSQIAWSNVRERVGDLVECLDNYHDVWEGELLNAQFDLRQSEDKVNKLELKLATEKAVLGTKKAAFEEKKERLEEVERLQTCLSNKSEEMSPFTKPSSWVQGGKWISVDKLLVIAHELKDVLKIYSQYLWGAKKPLGVALELLDMVDEDLSKQLESVSIREEDKHV